MFFNVYMDDLSTNLSRSEVGCNINGQFLNHFMYADDICIVAPCANALQRLLDICTEHADGHNIVFNDTKSVCMCVNSVKYNLDVFPTVSLGKHDLLYVSSYKYLGCVINEKINDNDYIKRTLRGIYARANMLCRKFYNCSDDVKAFLFRTYCTNFYCVQLWCSYSTASLHKVRVAFNNSFRMLMGFSRRCSASGMFVNSYIDDFNTLRRKVLHNFTCRVKQSKNVLLLHLASVRDFLPLPSVREYYNTLYTSSYNMF